MPPIVALDCPAGTYVPSTDAPLALFPLPGAYRRIHRPSASAAFSKSSVTAWPASTPSTEYQSSSPVVTSALTSLPSEMAAAVASFSSGSYWSGSTDLEGVRAGVDAAGVRPVVVGAGLLGDNAERAGLAGVDVAAGASVAVRTVEVHVEPARVRRDGYSSFDALSDRDAIEREPVLVVARYLALDDLTDRDRCRRRLAVVRFALGDLCEHHRRWHGADEQHRHDQQDGEFGSIVR